MQCGMDSRMAPNMHQIYGPLMNTINAYVYEKGLQPKPLGGDQVDLVYYAATNPKDPVGPDSINTTSQNWPLGATLAEAALAKTDMFERFERPPGTNRNFAEGYKSWSLIDLSSNRVGEIQAPTTRLADEGASGTVDQPPINPDHGRYMPGIAHPYSANDPQAFSTFVAAEQWFTAQWLPITGIDDSGRVNNFPLFRVEARETGTARPLAATDTVMTTGGDLHCRECHGKGGIAANPNTPRTKGQPILFDSASESLFDQEYAALRNAFSLHEYNDFGVVDDGSHHGGDHAHGRFSVRFDLGKNGDSSAITNDGPLYCQLGCHSVDVLSAVGIPQSQGVGDAPRYYRSDSSSLYHKFHGRLQYNAEKSDILRDADGRYKRFESPTESNPNSLFPVKDAQGKPLPMEQNCLRCHSGQREQCYRDRMYTAGVTCYQCHGDMLAVGNGYPRSKLGPDGNPWREPWIDQPDCASCHTGNGNRGKDGTGGFFSAGVRRTAFDEADLSATPFRPDRSNPDEWRFSVPVSDTGKTRIYDFIGGQYTIALKAPLFRLGKDSHGQVACAACHGAAHAIWPNRDPNANDNITAIQLQGHSGHLVECGVCHSADAFAQAENLDEGAKAPDATAGVLGGPHNLHPVNDSNWWLRAGTPSGATVTGGWHVSYTGAPGKAGEDQCVACHGNDRLGSRLSKAAADREFVGDQGQPVKIAAGTPVSCKDCHSIEKSCKGSPDSQCGVASDRVAPGTNRPPVVTASPTYQVSIGSDFNTKLTASDPDGDHVQFKLGPVGEGISIDPESGTLSVSGSYLSQLANQAATAPPFNPGFTVIATDSKGAYSTVPVTLEVNCPSDLIWDPQNHNCAALIIASSPPESTGLNAGTRFTFTFKAISANALPITYQLADSPADMSMDGSGAVTWDTTGKKGDYGVNFIARDTEGNEVSMGFNLTICGAPMHWDALAGICAGAVHVKAQDGIPPGLNAGETFRLQVEATHDQGLPMTYTLKDAPEGVTANSTGLVVWDTTGAAEGPYGISVLVADTLGNEAQGNYSLQVCGANSRWNAAGNTCSPIIVFITGPATNGIDAGQNYRYEFKATHLDGLPLIYRLENAPPGLNLDVIGRTLTWQPTAANAGFYLPELVATDDEGHEARQQINLNVCAPPGHWKEEFGACQE